MQLLLKSSGLVGPLFDLEEMQLSIARMQSTLHLQQWLCVRTDRCSARRYGSNVVLEKLRAFNI